MKRPTRPCEICEGPIPWATGDYPKRYAQKRFCRRACANRARRVWKSASEYNKWYAERHKEEIKRQNAERYQAHKAEEQERNAAWRKANPDYHAKWRRANADKCRIYEQNRRARLAKNGGSFTEQEWLALLEQHGHRCAACGIHNNDSPMTIDHIIPVSKGGVNDISNIQPLCSMCNCKKAAS